MRNFPFADFVTNGYGSKNLMLWLTPFTWNFFDFSKRAAEIRVFFLYCFSISSNYYYLILTDIFLIDLCHVFWKIFWMVYMLFPMLPFCIRNAMAALVMKYGTIPFCDLRASSYAYKMRIWSKDLIWLCEVCAFRPIPLIHN